MSTNADADGLVFHSPGTIALCTVGFIVMWVFTMTSSFPVIHRIPDDRRRKRALAFVLLGACGGAVTAALGAYYAHKDAITHESRESVLTRMFLATLNLAFVYFLSALGRQLKSGVLPPLAQEASMLLWRLSAVLLFVFLVAGKSYTAEIFAYTALASHATSGAFDIAMEFQYAKKSNMMMFASHTLNLAGFVCLALYASTVTSDNPWIV